MVAKFESIIPPRETVLVRVEVVEEVATTLVVDRADILLADEALVMRAVMHRIIA